MKIALITGITGQDGSYLTELLIEKSYTVYGIIRRSSQINTQRIDQLYDHPNLLLRYGDVTDIANLQFILKEIANKNPEIIEIYNLAAQSHVKVSFELPLYTAQVDAIGTLNILECIRSLGLVDKTRFYQASTSEMFGKVKEVPQSETTPFYPRSPYGVAKVYAYWITVNYREACGMFACNGILFNHESPRRGHNFVTRKITRAVNAIMSGKQECLHLGNLDSKRDWGHAKDYVRAMWLMLQNETPEDFVVSTAEQHTVREFVEMSFKEVGVDIVWNGEGLEEVGKCKDTGKVLVKISDKYFRPTEVETLLGDCSKIKEKLGWTPTCTFEEMVAEMIKSDRV